MTQHAIRFMPSTRARDCVLFHPQPWFIFNKHLENIGLREAQRFKLSQSINP